MNTEKIIMSVKKKNEEKKGKKLIHSILVFREKNIVHIANEFNSLN